MKSTLRFALAALTMLTSACSTRQIIRDAEYKHSAAAFRSGDVSQALERFPKKENKGFVTSIEKSWLSFWDGGRNHDDLMAQAKTLDDRKFTSVSREAQYFFYSEAEDGYIPAEHEVIVMHLINAMYFMRNEKWSEARVEARRAAFFLQSYFKEDQSHFDDPALRIWLASIWASLGEWQEALVDFRKAYDLSKDKSLLPLLQMDRPPKNLSLIFSGAGPKVEWEEGVPTPHFSEDSSKPTQDRINFSTLPWFQRHETRNSEIRKVVMKSNYMAQYYSLNTSVGAEKSIGYLASGTLLVGGVLAAVAIVGGGMYLLAAASNSQGNSGSNVSGDGEAVGYIFAAGLIVGGLAIKGSNDLARKFGASTAESKSTGLENLKIFRFVRFMPSWISVTDTVAFTGLTAKSFSMKAPSSSTSVLFLQNF